MRLLGLRICEHNSNFSFFDGEKVHYLKTERKFNIKHHAVNDLNLWKDIIYEEWGIKENDLTEIAVVFDPWRYFRHVRDDNFFPSIKLDNFSYNCPVTRVNHHYAHHLSCWPIIKNPSKLNGFSIDGYGDYNQVWTIFKNGKIKERGFMNHGSIGQGYRSLARWFDLEGSEYDLAGKVMGLQSFGKLDKEFYNFLKKFDFYQTQNIFDVNYYLDKPEFKLDWIRTVHLYVNDLLLNFLEKNFHSNETFCYTGGVALNVCWNTEIKKKFKNIVIPPHCSDEGLSLGALEFLRLKYNLSEFKIDNFPFCQSDESPNTEPTQEVYGKVAELLTKQKIIGWYQGHGEIGPRALGHRSILADPRDKAMKEKVNLIKKREYFRPFGCSTIDEEYSNSDFMLFADRVHKKKYPAVLHVDNTTRHQKVYQDNSLHALLCEFKRLTNCGTLLNTSLNINGKPLVSSKNDAMQILENSSLDGLVYGNELYLKNG